MIQRGALLCVVALRFRILAVVTVSAGSRLGRHSGASGMQRVR